MFQRSGAERFPNDAAVPADVTAAPAIDAFFGAVVLCLLVGMTWWLIYSYGYIEDDAFIHLEFARSVSEGRGFVFNGMLVNGDTSPLWVLLLTTVHTVGFGWIASAKILDMLGILVALTGTWRIAHDLARTGTSLRFLVPAALLVVSVNPYFVHWSFSGMEAVTALGISLWAIWSAFAPLGLSTRRATTGALLISVAPLLRPELLLLGAMCGPVLLHQFWRLNTKSTLTQRLLMTIPWGVVMALPTLLWAGYAIHSFGAPVPTTNAAKRGGDLISIATHLSSVYLLGFGVVFAIFPFVARRLMRPHVPLVIWALLLWPLACAAFYLVDHTLVQTRYCLLSMPCFAIAVLWLLAEVTSPAWAWRGLAAMMTAAIATLVLIVYPHVSNKVRLVKNVSDAVAFIRDNIPPGAPIAVYSIGQFAFESRHPLIDIGGITRPDVLPYLSDLPAAIRWAKSQGAAYYIGGDPPEPDAERVFSYSEPFLSWSLDRSRYDTATTTGIYRFATAQTTRP